MLFIIMKGFTALLCIKLFELILLLLLFISIICSGDIRDVYALIGQGLFHIFL